MNATSRHTCQASFLLGAVFFIALSIKSKVLKLDRHLYRDDYQYRHSQREHVTFLREKLE